MCACVCWVRWVATSFNSNPVNCKSGWLAILFRFKTDNLQCTVIVLKHRQISDKPDRWLSSLSRVCLSCCCALLVFFLLLLLWFDSGCIWRNQINRKLPLSEQNHILRLFTLWYMWNKWHCSFMVGSVSQFTAPYDRPLLSVMGRAHVFSQHDSVCVSLGIIGLKLVNLRRERCPGSPVDKVIFQIIKTLKIYISSFTNL